MKKTIQLFIFIFSLQIVAQIPIQEFDFNGTLDNTKNTITFTGIPMYVNDKAGNAKSAQRLSNNFLEVSIGNLPLANRARTVSIWIKYNDITTANYIWGYGSSLSAQYFGLLQQSTTTSKSDLNLAGWGPANDAIVTTTIAANTWYNYTASYDGLTSKIYRNGELIKSSISPRKSTSNLVFNIGKMGSLVSINADIDDLKIYDVALTDSEVATIYNTSLVITPNESITVASTIKLTGKKTVNKISKTGRITSNGSTNPNIIHAAPVETSSPKSTEIYSAEGEKIIASSKQEINISSLPEGSYLLKIKNTNQENKSNKLTVK